MAKDTSISIRLDSSIKEQVENVLDQFGLNMTIVVNMLFHQIVREQAIPLSLSLNPRMSPLDEINAARVERNAGYNGRASETVINDMEYFVAEAVKKYDAKKI